MRVRLNLATKPLVAHRRFLAGSGALGVAAAIVFVALGWHVYLARKSNAEMRAKSAGILAQVSQMEEQRAALDRFFSLPENHNLSDRAAFINRLIDARSFNWTLMFMDLERVLPAGVRVVSITPAQENGRVEVKLTVGATSDEAKLNFLKALENSKSFTHVVLLDVHTPTQATNSDQFVLVLTAEYART